MIFTRHRRLLLEGDPSKLMPSPRRQPAPSCRRNHSGARAIAREPGMTAYAKVSHAGRGSRCPRHRRFVSSPKCSPDIPDPFAKNESGLVESARCESQQILSMIFTRHNWIFLECDPLKLMPSLQRQPAPSPRVRGEGWGEGASDRCSDSRIPPHPARMSLRSILTTLSPHAGRGFKQTAPSSVC